MAEYWNDEKLVKRFFDKVNKIEGGCWEWKAYCYKNGYGKFGINYKTVLPHRVSFEIANKRFITDGMCILHSCDNRKCVNPLHLSEGTYKDNTADMFNKNRQGGNLKLTEQQVLEIREKYSTGNYSQYKLAEEYNISRPNIGYIIRNEIWTHI